MSQLANQGNNSLQLAENGRAILKLIGNGSLVQHQISGRFAAANPPDVLWDRHDLERLHARLEDKYELKERAKALSRKLSAITETAEVLVDITNVYCA